MTFSEYKDKLLQDPEVAKEYELLEPRYQLISEMLRCRNEKEMSQQDLADAIGINRADISRLENGNANPSLKTLERIATGVGKRLVISFQ